MAKTVGVKFNGFHNRLLPLVQPIGAKAATWSASKMCWQGHISRLGWAGSCQTLHFPLFHRHAQLSPCCFGELVAVPEPLCMSFSMCTLLFAYSSCHILAANLYICFSLFPIPWISLPTIHSALICPQPGAGMMTMTTSGHWWVQVALLLGCKQWVACSIF